jgi:hypothetical protein
MPKAEQSVNAGANLTGDTVIFLGLRFPETGGPMEPSPELLILLAALEARREQKGAEWCRKHGIGAQRVILGTGLKVVSMAARSPEAATFVRARKEAADLLMNACRVCGGCKMAHE